MRETSFSPNQIGEIDLLTICHDKFMLLAEGVNSRNSYINKFTDRFVCAGKRILHCCFLLLQQLSALHNLVGAHISNALFYYY